jgi:uncharacterized protein YbjT (DUF2867 family)
VSAASAALEGRTIVVLGATGYLGRLLVPALGAAGARVRATARRPEDLTGVPHAERTRVLAGDGYALSTAVLGADVVCDLWPAPLRATGRVDEACSGSARVVRVACLTDARPADPKPGVVELRASLVIGAGSPGFELLRRLADRLPVLPLPRYADRRLQPVAAGDVVSCLVAACDGTVEEGTSYALVGPDTLTVREMLSLVGGLLGRRTSRLAMPFDAPGAASLVRRLVGTEAQSAQTALEGLEEDVLVPRSDVESLIGRPPTSFELAARAALAAGRRLR